MPAPGTRVRRAVIGNGEGDVLYLQSPRAQVAGRELLVALLAILARRPVGNYDQLPGHIRRVAAGRSFVDVGCMWGVDGEYAFAAEAAGRPA